MDYAVTATQKEILNAFNMTAANIRAQAAAMNEDLMQKRDELRSKELMESFDFIDEHLYEFCMDNRMYSEYAYQSDPEGDEPSADITLDEAGLCKGQKFALHYDFGDDWMFTITVSKISEVQGDFKPRIVKEKGSIQQYPDWDEDEFDEE